MKKEEKSTKLQGIYEKLAWVQNEMPALPKNATAKIGGKFEYKYITLDQILEKLLPLCKQAGLAVFQRPDGEFLETVVTNIDKPEEQIKSRLPLIGANGTMQQYGSSLTYSRRYSLSCLFEIACDFDDDANLASNSEPRGPGFPNAPASEKQINYIKYLADKTNTNLADIATHYNVESIEKLTTSLAGEVINILQDKQYLSKVKA